MTKAAKRTKNDFIEIRRGMRSFAFLNLQASISHISDLLGSASLFNEFPHTIKNEVFFEYANRKYAAKEYIQTTDDNVTDYILRLDLGRNIDFLYELAFLHLTNRFLVYCSDILAVSALGSPEHFDLSIRIQAAKLVSAKASDVLTREVGVAVVSRITFMTYSELRKLLLSKLNLSKVALKKFEVVDRSVRKRNRFTHVLGISNLVVDIYESGKWRPREKIKLSELNALWRSIAELARVIDIAMMKRFNVWRGVDICAPGLYRRKGGGLIREKEKGAYD